MPVVDLNADLGESDVLTDTERSVLQVVTSTSVSCGAHAGTRDAIRATLQVAAAGGVVVGAHPSYPDRAGVGRRTLSMSRTDLLASLADQIVTLAAAAAEAGASLRFVKPHGALYNEIVVDAQLAEVVIDAVMAAQTRIGQAELTLLLQAGAVAAPVASNRGLRCATEGFADRAYQPDGRLVGRDQHGAVLTDEHSVVTQALSIVCDQRARAVDGSWVALQVSSLCVHGDTPGAARLAAAVRGALVDAGVDVAPFAA